MFDYSSEKPLPANNGPLSGSQTEHIVWDHAPLRSFSARPLSPFSYSMLAEILRRGWFNYYSKLGFEPQHGANLCRQHQGWPYLNQTISAELEASNAGITPLSMRVDGEERAIVSAKKRGLFAGLTGGRSQRKIQSTQNEFRDEMGTITQKARDWYLKTQDLKWSQAEILQIMEEVERFGTDSLMAFFAARHNIDLLQNRLLWALQEQAPFPQSLPFVHRPAQEIAGTVEHDLGQRITELRAKTDEDFDAALADLIDTYGHRCFSEGELSQPRWNEDSTSLINAINSDTFCTSDANNKDALLDAVAPQQQKEAGQWLDQLEPLYQLESEARNAFAYIQAGTRTWSKAAVQEAMGDNRILNADDVYLFELEQVKQMMTGEWNVSSAAEIQAEADSRRAEIAARHVQTSIPLLINNVELTPSTSATASHFWLGA